MSMIQGPLDGISGALAGDGDELRMALVTFIAISWYNVMELIVLVLSTFRRWRGLYFWSLLLSSCFGVMPYSLGFLLKFFTGANSFISVTVLSVGWWVMVTGQALVLYSRLHLVVRDERMLRRVLYMICATVLFLHVPTTVLTYGSNMPGRTPLLVRGYNIMEKIQMTGFTIQEAIISGLYVFESVKLLRLGSERENRKIMHQLVGINIFIILMDLILLSLEYADYYAIQITLKGAVYSLKLKLEFAVLGRLVDVIRRGADSSLRLCTLQHVGDTAAGAPPSHPGDPHFYGESAADAMTTPQENSSTERINVPQGRILAKKEFSAWIEERPSAYDQ